MRLILLNTDNTLSFFHTDNEWKAYIDNTIINDTDILYRSQPLAKAYDEYLNTIDFIYKRPEEISNMSFTQLYNYLNQKIKFEELYNLT